MAVHPLVDANTEMRFKDIKHKGIKLILQDDGTYVIKHTKKFIKKVFGNTLGCMCFDIVINRKRIKKGIIVTWTIVEHIDDYTIRAKKQYIDHVLRLKERFPNRMSKMVKRPGKE